MHDIDMIFMPLLAAGVQHLLAVQDMRCRVNDMSCLPLIVGVQHSVAVQDMRKAVELNLSARCIAKSKKYQKTKPIIR